MNKEKTGSVQLPQAAPRDPAQFAKRIDFGNGLRGWIFTGIIFDGVGLLALVSVPFGPAEGGLILFKVTAGIVFGAAGLLFSRKYRHDRKKRIQLFTRGRHATGTVTAYGRAFSPWKSARDYTLTVEVALSDGTTKKNTIRSNRESLHTGYAIGSSIDLLVDDVRGEILFPGVLDAEIEWV